VLNGRVLLDLEGAIQGEYRRYLSPSGQPGTGDRFYQEILHSSPRVVERVSLEKRPDGEYQALPQTLMDIGFDPSDRKFAALAKSENVPVVNATDSDWLERFHELQASGIKVWNLCGCDSNAWFVDP
jgi:hypothetical protein